MNGDIKIKIEKRSNDYNRTSELSIVFTCNMQEWKQVVNVEHLQKEDQRKKILTDIARRAAGELIVPMLVHNMLNALVSSALKGENPLE
jgi:hypothetical protein